MGYLSRMIEPARRRLGRAVHDAGMATRSDVSALRSEIQQLRDQLTGQSAPGWPGQVNAQLRTLTDRVDWLDRDQGEARDRLAAIENLLAIESFTRFVRHASLQTQPLVSVVLPTYNRPDRVLRAIDTVVAQRYAHWELILIDDGGDGDSSSLIDAIADPRLRFRRIDHQGPGAARNAGLALAEGEIVAYLDDDNMMDPDWLYAVVWAFEQRPEVDVLYGAFVIDDILRVGGEASGQLPRTILHQWDREALRRGNLADTGAIAHRAGLAQAHFDESLMEMADWDLLLRLTADRDPLVLPAIACYYTTDATDRLTLGPTHAADLATVKTRAGLAAR